MRSYVLQIRWLPWHALWAVLLAGCLGMAWWQWDVATSPHPPGAPVQVWRNYAYAANWLIFAGVAVWFWWRYMRDQRAADQRAAEQREQVEQLPSARSQERLDRPQEPQQPTSRMVEFDIFGSTSGADQADEPEQGRRG